MGPIASPDGHTSGNGHARAEPRQSPGHVRRQRDGDGQRAAGDRPARDVVRDMVREERAHSTSCHTRSAPSADRAEAEGKADDGRGDARGEGGGDARDDALGTVEQSIRDLKHDVRMLKVGLDKQGAVLERLVDQIDRLSRRDDHHDGS